MKKCFYSLLFFALFQLSFNVESKAQSRELVKPEQNISVKKAEQNSANTNSNGSGETYKTKMELFGTNTVNPTPVNDNPSNATRDAIDYQDKKIQLIKENPEAYKKYSNNPNLTILTESELNALPIEEQTRILADEINYLIIRQ